MTWKRSLIEETAAVREYLDEAGDVSFLSPSSRSNNNAQARYPKKTWLATYIPTIKLRLAASLSTSWSTANPTKCDAD